MNAAALHNNMIYCILSLAGKYKKFYDMEHRLYWSSLLVIIIIHSQYMYRNMAALSNCGTRRRSWTVKQQINRITLDKKCNSQACSSTISDFQIALQIRCVLEKRG